MGAVESLKFCTLKGSFCPNHVQFHVTYAFQSESTLYSCLNVKELLARNRPEVLSLSDWNWTRTPLSLRTKWLWVRVQLQSLNDMRNLVKFYLTTQKSGNFTWMGSFFPKCIRFELKRYRGVIFHDTEQ